MTKTTRNIFRDRVICKYVRHECADGTTSELTSLKQTIDDAFDRIWFFREYCRFQVQHTSRTIIGVRVFSESDAYAEFGIRDAAGHVAMHKSDWTDETFTGSPEEMSVLIEYLEYLQDPERTINPTKPTMFPALLIVLWSRHGDFLGDRETQALIDYGVTVEELKKLCARAQPSGWLLRITDAVSLWCEDTRVPLIDLLRLVN